MISKWILPLFLILCLAGGLPAADVTIHVDPDGTGDYTALNTAMATEAKDITGIGNYIFDCFASSGTPDTTAATFSATGWVTDATHRVKIIGQSSYLLSTTDATALTLQEDNWDVVTLRVQLTATGTNNVYAINVTGSSPGPIDTISKCKIHGVNGSTGVVCGIRFADADIKCNVSNCIIDGFINGADNSPGGIIIATGNTINLWQNTIYNCYTGASQTIATAAATNCVVFGCTNDFAGTWTLLNCANDDDADAHTGRVDLNENASGEWTASFTSYTTGDFTIKNASSPLYNAGTSLAGTVDDDIIGTARPQASTYDIGAYELVAEAPAGDGAVSVFHPGFDTGFDHGFEN